MTCSHNPKRSRLQVRNGLLQTCCRTLLIACGFCGLLPAAAPPVAAATVEVSNFGSNPGKLRMFKHIPDQLPSSAPLIVVMHGCKQDEPTFANECGFTSPTN